MGGRFRGSQEVSWPRNIWIEVAVDMWEFPGAGLTLSTSSLFPAQRESSQNDRAPNSEDSPWLHQFPTETSIAVGGGWQGFEAGRGAGQAAG